MLLHEFTVYESLAGLVHWVEHGPVERRPLGPGFNCGQGYMSWFWSPPCPGRYCSLSFLIFKNSIIKYFEVFKKMFLKKATTTKKHTVWKQISEWSS